MISANGQTNFQDLNFESATLSPAPVDQAPATLVPITSALPGWSASIGNTPVTQIQQNSFDYGAATIDIFGPNYGPVGQLGSYSPGIIDGNYTVFLQSGGGPNGGADVSLSQVGTVPANAQSLEFKAWSWPSANAAFSVSFAGNSLSPVLIGSTPNYDDYGVNIAPYAGQTGELKLTAIVTDAPSWIEFDDIAFSPYAVPEPSTLALVLMGGLALAARLRRAK